MYVPATFCFKQRGRQRGQNYRIECLIMIFRPQLGTEISLRYLEKQLSLKHYINRFHVLQCYKYATVYWVDVVTRCFSCSLNIPRAKWELSELNACKSPQQKLLCLKKVILTIMQPIRRNDAGVCNYKTINIQMKCFLNTNTIIVL